MRKKLTTYLKKNKVTVALILAFVSIIYSGFTHYRTGKQIDQTVVAVINAQNANQNFYEGYQRVVYKMQGFQTLGISNQDIGIKVLDYYEKAMVMAKDRDEEYHVYEFLGDTIIESYMEGIKDGKKALLGAM